MKNQCSSDAPPLGNPVTGPRWNGWSPDPTSNALFQTAAAAGLTAAQVPKLKLKWAFGFPGGAIAWGQPVIAGGWMFVGSDNGHVYALDARTGCVHWSFAALSGVRTSISVGPSKGIPGVRYLAFFGDVRTNVYAVNAETGKQVWTVRIEDKGDPIGLRLLAAPNFDPVSGRLFVPVTSWEEVTSHNIEYECCKTRGAVVALDSNTGKQIWKTYTMEEARPLRKNASGTQLYGPAGAAVWSPPTRDPKRNALYFGTGNAFIPPDTGTSDSIFAVDLDTGARLWVHQLLANDISGGGCGNTAEEHKLNCPDPPRPAGGRRGNDDVAASPILKTLPNGRRVLITLMQMGTVTALDPDNNGQVLWEREAGNGTTEDWGGLGAAADDENVYVPVSSHPGDRTGGMVALRLVSGERIWYTQLPEPMGCVGEGKPPTWCKAGLYAAASAIPGAVFAGSRDGILRAFSTADGRIIWEYDTKREFQTINGVPANGGSIGGPPPTIVGGMVYSGSGYWIGGGAAGNVMLAFAVE
jgi:polyvinyl alcohol dehydrogenase (cytochrome)